MWTRVPQFIACLFKLHSTISLTLSLLVAPTLQAAAPTQQTQDFDSMLRSIGNFREGGRGADAEGRGLVGQELMEHGSSPRPRLLGSGVTPAALRTSATPSTPLKSETTASAAPSCARPTTTGKGIAPRPGAATFALQRGSAAVSTTAPGVSAETDVVSQLQDINRIKDKVCLV
jgi:hypothetical protein